MRILHTEASLGFGGQEMRILREAIGLRKRGHHLLFALAPKSKLSEAALAENFEVLHLPYRQNRIKSVAKLLAFLRACQIDVVNTHSSIDAWVAGIAARIAGCPIVRTRHISSHIKGGLNAYLLYHLLADCVVTTCQETADVIQKKARLSSQRCFSIPTGVEPERLQVTSDAAQEFRKRWNIAPHECLVVTLCVLRRWKGVADFIQAAHLLKNEPIRWLVVGSGPSENLFFELCKKYGLSGKVQFTGYLQPPFTALAASDVFALLSTDSEGVSQASLQAAYLGKPLITTSIGGLKEVCIDHTTGFIVPPFAPKAVAEKVLFLHQNREVAQKMGKFARALVQEEFLFCKTIAGMEGVFTRLLHKA